MEFVLNTMLYSVYKRYILISVPMNWIQIF